MMKSVHNIWALVGIRKIHLASPYSKLQFLMTMIIVLGHHPG